jgi:hypothetical protein
MLTTFGSSSSPGFAAVNQPLPRSVYTKRYSVQRGFVAHTPARPSSSLNAALNVPASRVSGVIVSPRFAAMIAAVRTALSGA